MNSPLEASREASLVPLGDSPLQKMPAEIISLIASLLDVGDLCKLRCTFNRQLCSYTFHSFGHHLARLCVMFERKSLTMLKMIAKSDYREFVSELSVQVVPTAGPAEMLRYPRYASDRHCILTSGLDLLWLTSALEKFEKLRIVRIIDDPIGTAGRGHPLGYRSLPGPYILDAIARSSEDSRAHTVLVVLTALSEANVNLHTFDVLLSSNPPRWDDDDFDLDSDDSPCVHGVSSPGLDFQELCFSEAYFTQIREFMARLQCLRLHASSYLRRDSSPQLAQLITLAPGLRRLDVWCDPPASPLFRSLAESNGFHELGELTLVGTSADVGGTHTSLSGCQCVGRLETTAE